MFADFNIMLKKCLVLTLFASLILGYECVDPQRKKTEMEKYSKRVKKKAGKIILTNGKYHYEGNVEIFHNGVWGNICDDEWDMKDATVVCKQLGFRGVEKITHNSHFGPAVERFWMDNLFCTGTEKHLSHCHFEGWGLTDCDSTEAAGVVCDPFGNSSSISDKPLKKMRTSIRQFLKTNLQVRLMGGRVAEEGRVEVKHNDSEWGVICGESWSILEAMVVCRMLGLNFASYAAQTNFFGGNSTGIALSGVSCRGDEKSLDQCTIETVDSSNCSGKQDQIAGVICSSKLPDLIIDTEELERSSYIEDVQMYSLQCAMEENCLASSAYRIQRDKKANWHLQMRRLLRFTAKITNIGNTDFRPLVPKYQWEYHQCHMHYHSMEVFATFDVLDQGGEKVAEGHKASFCLEDNQCSGKTKPVFACADYGDQGISVNCSDIYRHNIDCQWVDISELSPGLYSFKVSVNPEFKVAEMTYSNNMAICSMYYAETFVRIYNCSNQHP